MILLNNLILQNTEIMQNNLILRDNSILWNNLILQNTETLRKIRSDRIPWSVYSISLKLGVDRKELKK